MQTRHELRGAGSVKPLNIIHVASISWSAVLYMYSFMRDKSLAFKTFLAAFIVQIPNRKWVKHRQM